LTNKGFELYVERDAWVKMSALARMCDHEISGLGRVEVREGVPHIVEVAILKQEGTSGSTHLDIDALQKFIADDIAKRVEEKRDLDTDWRMWFHSHPGGSSGAGPSYSSTDVHTIAELGDLSRDSKKPYFLGIVLDSQGKGARAYAELRHPVSISLEGTVMIHKSKEEQEAEKWAAKEIKDKVGKVKTRATKSPLPGTGKGKGQAGSEQSSGQRSGRGGYGALEDNNGQVYHGYNGGPGFKWFGPAKDQVRYVQHERLNNLFIPDPVGPHKEEHDTLPLRQEDGKACFVRALAVEPQRSKKGKFEKRRKADTAAIRYIFDGKSNTDPDIEPGSLFTAGVSLRTFCRACGWEAVKLDGNDADHLALCLQSERLVKNCRADRLDWTVDFGLGIYELAASGHSSSTSPADAGDESEEKVAVATMVANNNDDETQISSMETPTEDELAALGGWMGW